MRNCGDETYTVGNNISGRFNAPEKSIIYPVYLVTLEKPESKPEMSAWFL